MASRASASMKSLDYMMRFRIRPDNFNLVEFRRVLKKPFDGEPMRAGGEGGERGLSHVAAGCRARNDRFHGSSGSYAGDWVTKSIRRRGGPTF